MFNLAGLLRYIRSRGRLAPLRSETAAGTAPDALGGRHVPRKSYVEDSAHRRGQRAQYEAVQRPSGSPWLPDVEDARRHPGPVERAGTSTSEARRVGKECASPSHYGWAPA